jgi:hypothetical protein
VDDDLEQLLQTAEQQVTDEVRVVLDELADEIAAELEDATEIVAARFSLSRITSMWAQRVPRIMRRLFRVAQTAGQQAAADVDGELPDDWTDLPGRYDDDTLPPSLGDYAEATEHLLRAVGDRLTEAAITALAEGLDAGEDTEALRTRLRALFSADGAQLGETREERIARTESTRVWNAATLAAAQALTGPDRPLVKQWITRHDQRVRETHADADAQLQLLDEPFRVGGVDMAYPGDPTASAALTVNCRCVLALARADTEQSAATSPAGEGNLVRESHTTAAAADDPPPILTWSTPGDAALAFIGQQTGDGRVFAEGSLYWEGGPWPLQYADEMGAGHDGAELAGAIQEMDIDGPRLTGTGVLYLMQRAGAEAAMLLRQGAPLGVSVDLDDVDIELVDNTSSGENEGEDNDLVLAAASYARASVLPLHDGGWMITASSTPEWTASGAAMQSSTRTASVISGPGGRIPADAARALFPGALTAAAGDPDNPQSGTVVHTENSGDLLVRITRARVRGATLVAMPAYDKARIVLDPTAEQPVDEEEPVTEVAAAAGDDLERVIGHVCTSPVPVGAREVADALGLTVSTTKRHLRTAVRDGRVLRIGRGLYTAPSSIPEGEMIAAASGDLGLPVHAKRDAEWDGDAAASRVLDWATGDDGTVDADALGRAFLYRDPDADPATLTAYKLGFADVFDTGDGPRLEIVASGVYAVAGALSGARGGVDIPENEQEQIREHVDDLYESLATAFDDPSIRPPWDDDTSDDDGDMSELEASAWRVMQEQPPMPAEWFREPTEEELPPGSGGVHYKDGRVYGWVAQAGVPHAVYGRKVMIDKLGPLDFSHFLRAEFELDDGTMIAVGAFTMNVGHHRDGWQCETAACQFDDSGTVAAIVTVGQNKGGLWFSGAAAPWISEWDLRVFRSCQPSYHLTQSSSGQYELRAVLTVPVPGHSSPLKPGYRLAAAAHLAATAVVERANLALTAAAATLDAEHETTAEPEVEPEPSHRRAADTAPATDVVQAAADLLTSPAFLDRFVDAFEQRQTERARMRAELEALSALVEPTDLALTASAAPQQEGA